MKQMRMVKRQMRTLKQPRKIHKRLMIRKLGKLVTMMTLRLVRLRCCFPMMGLQKRRMTLRRKSRS
jgi:hypothetical protein